ncbi:PREDICTED: uncharacterized protein LOC106815862 [Priapulus caudatus]|uniref:Uncharacterized protein LOC106815862 n=1 Tax=Priapulus caudatus TaxID=37621 RepID=A0ABM1EUK0_PRICU|nr:PREDICTED: uncharacterized protein LOC106815862 [Priapulus caudatus]
MRKEGILSQLLALRNYKKQNVEKYLLPAERHAAELMEQAMLLQQQLEGASAQAEDPLKAASVYENIVNARRRGKDGGDRGHKAADEAYSTASKSGLTGRAKKLKQRNAEILEDANNLNSSGECCHLVRTRANVS